MPRGVAGTGPYSKANKKKADAEVALARLKRDALDDDDAPLLNDGKPRCRVCKAVLPAGGQCASCQKRAIHFKHLMQAEEEARRCEVCEAPAKIARRGRRLCTLCRKLTAREAKLGLDRPKRA